MHHAITPTVSRAFMAASLLLSLTAAVASAQPAKPAAAVKISEDKPGLLAKAKIKPDSAIALAKATVPGGTISDAEIENEDGALIYSFDIKVAGKKGIEEVHIDAMTGKMLKREHESPSDEKAEAAADKATKVKPPTAKKPPV